MRYSRTLLASLESASRGSPLFGGLPHLFIILVVSSPQTYLATRWGSCPSRRNAHPFGAVVLIAFAMC